MTAKELRERLAYVTEYEFRQPPQSAREHAVALATAKAHWKQIACDAIAALEERERETYQLLDRIDEIHGFMANTEETNT